MPHQALTTRSPQSESASPAQMTRLTVTQDSSSERLLLLCTTFRNGNRPGAACVQGPKLVLRSLLCIALNGTILAKRRR